MNGKELKARSEASKPNLLAVVFAVMAVISIFLPWFAVDDDSMNMIRLISELEGIRSEEPMLILIHLLWLIPVFSVVVIVVELNKKSERKLWSLVGKLGVVLLAAITVYGLLRVQRQIMPFGGSIFRIVSFGYWIMIVSAALLLVSVFYKPQNDD